MNVNSVNNKNYSIQQIRILGGIQMDRDFFLTTNRIGFSEWEKDDIKLAELLWGDPDVTRFICASGKFSTNDIRTRLEKEIKKCINNFYNVDNTNIYIIVQDS